MLAYSSPRLFAVNHVLLRLLVPRHPPCALYSLISLFLICMSFPRLFEIAAAFSSHLPSASMSFSSANYLTSLCSFQGALVGSSGLEPPTSRLSGVRSNQLSYEPSSFSTPAVLRRLPFSGRLPSFFQSLVEMNGFEPMTPCLQSRCSPS